MDSNHQYPEEKLPAINTAALRATENVLKVICDGKGWNMIRETVSSGSWR